MSDRPTTAIISKTNLCLLALVAVAIFRPFEASSTLAQNAAVPRRQPIDLAVVGPRTEGNANLVYRMWSDGSIDVRLFNPLDMPAHHWPQSDRAGLSFQDGWKVLQVGE